MKRALLKLVAVFEIVSGLAGIYAVVAGLIGMAPTEMAPMLWYGIFPIASVFGDCRVRLVLGINFLALAVLTILFSCKSEAQMRDVEPGAVTSV